ncbi:MAG: hypothetical protein QNJ68_00460 [Microcoleaceae cyanobacterium MO_207.B10]|nr:hypothetical protein [Microcoleaceae cyanobacterium MO_207.B10]
MNYRRLWEIKNRKLGFWSLVNHWKPGIILWEIGDRDRDAEHYHSWANC